jgi:hypothetical protein
VVAAASALLLDGDLIRPVEPAAAKAGAGGAALGAPGGGQ